MARAPYQFIYLVTLLWLLKFRPKDSFALRFELVIMTSREKRLDGLLTVKTWHKRMVSRPAWKRAMEKRDKSMDDQGLIPLAMPKGISDMAEYEAIK
nr:hypothetical protein CFP56_10319 [Quercus suber]